MVLDRVGSHGSGETLSDFCYSFKGSIWGMRKKNEVLLVS